MNTEWPFEDNPETPVITTKQVSSGKYPILYVSRELDEDGAITWQCLCLVVPFDMVDAQLVRLDTIVDLDPSLIELSDLQVGEDASRESPQDEWVRSKCS